MKRILSLLLVLGLILSFAGCSKDKGRLLYNADLDKYVTLGEYKGIAVDTSSDKYKEYYDSIIEQDVENNKLYVKKTDGKVKKGDTANIDYVGKKDGVAFEGGTAQGYDLQIGSNSFIEGFEDGLIGVAIGSTVDLNLKFPENYGNEELNGAKVVFTVKVNYVATNEKMKPEDYYKDLGYKSVVEYNANVKKRAIELFLYNKVMEASKVKEYPEEDIEYLKTEIFKNYENTLKNNYNTTLDEYLQSMGQTKAQFEESVITEQIKPQIEQTIVLYAILDNEKLSVTKEEIDKEIDIMVKQYNTPEVDAQTIKEYYGEYSFENKIVNDKVLDLLYKNAKIS